MNPGQEPAAPNKPAVVEYAPASPGPRRASLKYLLAGGMLLLAVSVLISVLVPSHDRKPIMAQRAVCASNLRAIWLASVRYASEHEGQFPPNFDVLLAAGSISEGNLVSRLSRRSPPVRDYAYVRGLTVHDPNDWILAYGNPAWLQGKDSGANVLFLDGQIGFLREPRFNQELQRFRAAFEEARGAPPVVIPPN